MINHAKNALGNKVVYIAFKKKGMTQVEITKNQLQKRIHCKYMKNTTIQELRGIENLCKETEFRFKDGRKPKLSSLLMHFTGIIINAPVSI